MDISLRRWAPRGAAVAVLIAGLISVSSLYSRDQADREEEQVREVALAMPRAIDNADWDAFLELFASDAIMYFPFISARAGSRDAIVAVMGPIFERNRQRTERPIFGFEPSEVAVRWLGPDAAVVTWVMPRTGALARRTAVLRRREGRWLIVVVHADNFPR